MSEATSTESEATSTESEATSRESEATSRESEATSRESEATSRIGLVLGAGGGAGGQWIRGVLTGLRATTGFRPEHASILIGTSIGAIVAAGIGPHTAPPREVVDALISAAPVRQPPPLSSRLLASTRLAAGRALAMASRPGEPDPMRWVEAIHSETRAQVCSVRRFPPTRRVASIATSTEPAREIAASAAIPFGARPIEIDDASHIDGAVWSVTNADLVRPTDVAVVVVIAPLVTTDGGTLVSSLGRHQLASELHSFTRAGVPALVFAPSSAQYRHRQDKPRHRSDGERLAHTLTS